MKEMDNLLSGKSLFLRLLKPIELFFSLTSPTVLDAEKWPASEDAAEASVTKAREEQAAAGEPLRTEADAWDQHKYVIATTTRIPVIEGVALSFKLGILKIAELLWRPTELKLALQRMSRTADSPTATYDPSDEEEEEDFDLGDAPNATTEQTRVLLKAIPRRIDVLLDSAGRTGAQTTLQTVLSWHPQVKLPQLYNIRENTTALLERTYAEVNRLASSMVNWFSVYTYTPFLDDEGNPLAATSMAGLADDSTYSSIRPYDNPAPQPTRSSSGYHYRNSDLSDSGSSHTSPRSKQGGTSLTAGQTEPSAAVAPTAAS